MADRNKVIKEFAEKLKDGLGDCRLVTDEAWISGFDTGDVYNLIDRIVREMEAGE